MQPDVQDDEDGDTRRLKQLINQLVAFVAVLDVEGRLRHVDSAALEIGGLRLQDVRGRPFWDTYWWSYDAGIQAQVRDALERTRNGETVRYETVARTAGNGRLPILFQVGPILDEGGRVVEIVASATDLSERRSAEARFEEHRREAEQRLAELESLYNALPVGVALHDRDMKFLRVNRQMAEFCGYPVDALPGREADVLLPDVAAQVRETMQRVFETGASVIGLDIRTSTPALPGLVRDFVADFYPVKLGGAVFAVGTCIRDVTEQRHLQRRVAASEARLRRVTDETPIMIALLDARARVTWTNQTAMRRLGAAEGRHVGRDYHGLVSAYLSDPEESDRLQGALSAARKGVPDRFDLRLRAPGAGDQVVEFQISPVREGSGEVTEIIATGIDVTDRHQHEERLRLLNRELNHRVKNLFWVVQSLVLMTSRGETDVATFTEKIRDRIAALAAAHMASMGEEAEQPASLRKVLAAVLAPYDAALPATGPDIEIPQRAVTPLGIILHELATNAARHGALSRPGGQLDVDWSLGPGSPQVVEIAWRERIAEDAPALQGPFTPRFGGRLMEGCAKQLSGRLAPDLLESGLHVTLTFPIGPDTAGSA